jgi:hypothetical protein
MLKDQLNKSLFREGISKMEYVKSLGRNNPDGKPSLTDRSNLEKSSEHRPRLMMNDSVTLPSRNTTINTSRSYFSVFSNSRKHLIDSQICSNKKFLKFLDQKF